MRKRKSSKNDAFSAILNPSLKLTFGFRGSELDRGGGKGPGDTDGTGDERGRGGGGKYEETGET